MLKIYGSMMCPDCVQCRKDLDQAGVKYEYLDFGDSLWNLKVFLQLRDTEQVFAELKIKIRMSLFQKWTLTLNRVIFIASRYC